VDVGNDWFDVRHVEPGIYAINQPKQFQESIAYLIVGTSRALLFDTGIGLVPLRPVIERLTALPVTVINSHSHFDHVGGNAEFNDVWGMDTPFTRENEAGRPHANLASEVASDALCGVAPTGADAATFASKPWSTAHRFADGERVDIGGRVLEIVHTPGHTPDAIALLDRANGLLWTGDSYYDSTIWLFSPGTDLDAYERSMARLSALEPSLRRLLPAHNTVSAPPARLHETLDAFRAMRRGEGVRASEGRGQLRVTVGRVSFLIRE
jgi:glyoxylase-like metal-dependent hydrolase (beta-lactamase superfamily II)